MGEQNHFIVNLGGGLNLVDTHYTLQQRLGSARELINYEPSIRGGYRRINGYEKYCSVSPTATLTADCGAGNYLDENYWVNGADFTWTGTVWQLGGSAAGGNIVDTGSWTSAFRPSNLLLKMYFPSGGGATAAVVHIRDTNNDSLGTQDFTGYALDTVHSVTIPLTFTMYDIDKITIEDFTYAQPEIRCIDFS